MNRFKTLHQKHAWILPLAIIAAAALIATLLMATKPSPPTIESKEKEWLVSIKPAEFVTASPELLLLGHVESPFNSQLSATIGAEVEKLLVREGQLVKYGDVLIELDQEKINLVAAQRTADVNELEALIKSENNRFASDKKSLKEEVRLLDIAKKAVGRQAKLKVSNLVAQERYDNAESQRAQQTLAVNARKLNIADHPSRLAQLQARLDRANAILRDVQIDVNLTHIRAPFDGIITSVEVSPGELIQAGQTLVSIYDKNNMEVRAQLPDRHIELIKKALAGDTLINAQAESYGQIIPLQLKRLSGQANSGTGGIDALFTLPDENQHEESLVLNSALEVRVQLPPLAEVITLPVSAIYGSNRIYRIEDGRLISIHTKILGKQLSSDSGQDQVILKSDKISAGDSIIITQLPNAISGLKVKARGE